MATTRRLSTGLLVALLAAVLVGPGGGEVTAAEPRVTVRHIMVPAAAFIPSMDGLDYFNGGGVLEMNSGLGTFTAPLLFPAIVVDIRRITLYAYDNAPSSVCVALYRAYPPGASQVYAGQVCTTGASATDPQVLYTTTLSPRQVNTALHGPFLALVLSGDTKFYGVKVTYSY